MGNYKYLEEMLDNFNFHKVCDIMEYLDWKWGGKVPTIVEMKETVRSIVGTAIGEATFHKEATMVATGGFMVRYDPSDDVLWIGFVPEDQDSLDYEDMEEMDE